MISDARMEKALTFLAETDERVAEAKTQVARCEYLCKRVRARLFLMSEGETVKAREAIAETEPQVERADEDLAQAILAYEKLRAKRTTEELVIETWRTMEASRRVGNL